MAEDKIPPSNSMSDVVDNTRNKDVTFPMVNRDVRRKFKHLKKRRDFQDALAKKGHTVEEAEEAMVDKKTQDEILKHLDVQKFLAVLNGLLTGQKRLVIETISSPSMKPDHIGVPQKCADYIHTFRVEDVDAN